MAATGWDTPPDEYGKLVVKIHKDLIQKAAIHLLRGVVLRSPVDTGRFRANWQITEGRVTQRIVDNFNEGASGSTKGSVTKQATREGTNAVLSAGKDFPTYYLTNNLPYAQRLENGWSDQAPQGMVALSLLETFNWVNRQ